MDARWAWSCDDPRTLESVGLEVVQEAAVTRPPPNCAGGCRVCTGTRCRWPAGSQVTWPPSRSSGPAHANDHPVPASGHGPLPAAFATQRGSIGHSPHHGRRHISQDANQNRRIRAPCRCEGSGQQPLNIRRYPFLLACTSGPAFAVRWSQVPGQWPASGASKVLPDTARAAAYGEGEVALCHQVMCPSSVAGPGHRGGCGRSPELPRWQCWPAW